MKSAMRRRTETVPVTMRALTQRINRKLAEDNMVLKTSRGLLAPVDLGRYYVVNLRSNAVMLRYRDCDPEKLGREYGVLKNYEHVVED